MILHKPERRGLRFLGTCLKKSVSGKRTRGLKRWQKWQKRVKAQQGGVS